MTLGCSRTFTVERVTTEGASQAWGGDIKLAVEVSRSQPPTIVNAVVNGSGATVTIPSSVCDLTKNTTSWQLIFTPASGNPVAVMVGKFERHDN